MTAAETRKLAELHGAWLGPSQDRNVRTLYRVIYREHAAIRAGRVRASRDLLRQVRGELNFVGRIARRQETCGN